jgi:hypothetical protein
MRHLLTTCLLAALPLAATADVLPWRGISLSSAEWGEKLPFPGEYGKDFVYPSVASTAYYQAQGMNLMRIAFRWERLQPVLNGDFDPTELGRLRAFVDGTTRTTTRPTRTSTWADPRCPSRPSPTSGVAWRSCSRTTRACSSGW